MSTITPDRPATRRTWRRLAQPLLRNGDRYTQPEFHALYEQTPEGFKAELIDGEVHIDMFPLSHEGHGAQDALLIGWLTDYTAETPGTEVGSNSTTILDASNEPQPDGLLRILPEFGGGTRLQDRYLQGSPELVFEVFYTSASIDLGRKKRAYQRAGIQEYLVWRTEDNELDWWELKEGIYVPLQRNGDGSAESRAFPGLLLDVPALLKRDLSRVLRRVREQLGGAGHLAFIKQLSSKRG